MITKYNKKNLIDFENKIAEAFNLAKIRAPVHLYSNNEEQMLKIFKDVKEEDWIFCSWRSHYQCLLKGVPEDELLAEILDGHSISLCFPDYRIFSSAIVGGSLPVAVGTAISVKKNKQNPIIYCFIGDMTAETGIAHECIKYSINYDLPIKFIIEDNNISVCSDTRKVWGSDKLSFENYNSDKVIIYKYQNKYPHSGAGVRVEF
jgi:TPP-dependent pyruvate/acetoin dehydrogenase alpha subunit